MTQERALQLVVGLQIIFNQILLASVNDPSAVEKHAKQGREMADELERGVTGHVQDDPPEAQMNKQAPPAPGAQTVEVSPQGAGEGMNPPVTGAAQTAGNGVNAGEPAQPEPGTAAIEGEVNTVAVGTESLPDQAPETSAQQGPPA